mmetsp:Transcript_93745/g.286851  ORF Transcript_93745/g.286851 Transcript_93745/m.286851 type:complete len:228 (-) Transcript_93745:106-789(-)
MCHGAHAGQLGGARRWHGGRRRRRAAAGGLREQTDHVAGGGGHAGGGNVLGGPRVWLREQRSRQRHHRPGARPVLGQWPCGPDSQPGRGWPQSAGRGKRPRVAAPRRRGRRLPEGGVRPRGRAFGVASPGTGASVLGAAHARAIAVCVSSAHAGGGGVQRFLVFLLCEALPKTAHATSRAGRDRPLQEETIQGRRPLGRRVDEGVPHPQTRDKSRRLVAAGTGRSGR